MSNTTLLIVIVVLLLVFGGGGGYYWRGRRYGPLDFFSMLKHADPSLAAYVKSLLGDPENDRKVYEASALS